MSDTDYCREGCATERLWGTASPVSDYVFITWPKRRWVSPALESEGLPESIAQWQVARAKRVRKTPVRLLWRPDADPDTVEVTLYPTGRRFRSTGTERVTDVLDLLDGGELPEGWTEVAAPASLIAVCTHGKHDRCCARWGQAVYVALRKAVAARGLDIEVAESSHLGGHRFAATALCMPSGDFYGRLERRDVAAWVDRLQDGRIWLERYRGRIWETALEQVVGIAARAALGLEGADEAPLLEVDAAGAWTARSGERVVRLRTRGEARKGLKSCGAAAAPETWERLVAEVVP